MTLALYIFCIAALGRLDGMGAGNSLLQKSASEVFGLVTCSLLAAFLTTFFMQDVVIGLLVGAGFALLRGPEMGDFWGATWNKWPLGFLRGAIPALPTFWLLGCPYAALIMGLAWMLLYNGGNRFYPNYEWRHHIAEWGSLGVYAAIIVGIV